MTERREGPGDRVSLVYNNKIGGALDQGYYEIDCICDREMGGAWVSLIYNGKQEWDNWKEIGIVIFILVVNWYEREVSTVQQVTRDIIIFKMMVRYKLTHFEYYINT